MTEPTAFRAGEFVAWRNCVRIDGSRVHHPSFAIAMTVVRDTRDELVLFRRAGHAMRRRIAERGSAPVTFRHAPVVRLFDDWREEAPWTGPPVLVVKQPQAHHAISLFCTGAGELAFWYIDLIGPVRRRAFGFDFPENGLDIVVQPDLSSWRWKDEDELEFAVQLGHYSRDEADELYAEGRRAVARLSEERAYFERWRHGRPDPAWPIATLPAGWDEV